ncbi:hypothetical protein L198_06274 [Cryptococcus wingfieldii CBS 7118]|uniref:Uncharacterized protein n=1 Tax=Cryptococcus wingfieldii CBS 7118 TaxID=1295528 RepID=A0A1E3IQP5_9TREE|nr:hypothetical protein L198_06274 [Cryptococcus wingfieldii CBS 7118]ODN90256.1 hypothetical protein L198_06274 [Cryptococcus wingfieldii CBS 7118]
MGTRTTNDMGLVDSANASPDFRQPPPMSVPELDLDYVGGGEVGFANGEKGVRRWEEDGEEENTPIPNSSNKSDPEEPVTRASLARMYKSSPVEGSSVAETSSGRKSLSESTIDTTTSSLSPNPNLLAHDESTTEGAIAPDLRVEQESAGMELRRKKKEKRERKKAEKKELEAKQKEMSDAEQEGRVVQDDTKGESDASSSASSPPHPDASESPSSVPGRLHKVIAEAPRYTGDTKG